MIVPDSIEPVVGWRSWAIREGAQPRLASVIFEASTWLPGMALVARCGGDSASGRVHANEAGAHDAPDDACDNDHGCGIYLARQPRQAASYMALQFRCPVNPGRSRRTQLAPMAVGLAAGWGKVIEHDDGWRCQYAYPKLLLIPEHVELAHDGRTLGAAEVTRLLSTTYKVPARTIPYVATHES